MNYLHAYIYDAVQRVWSINCVNHAEREAFFKITRCARKLIANGHWFFRQENGGAQESKPRPNYVYLDWIGHSPCNDGYVFAMLNVRLQNRAKLATMVTYCDAACIGGYEFSPLLHLHIYLSAHSIIAKNNTTPCNDNMIM